LIDDDIIFLSRVATPGERLAKTIVI
jgi:hypothetical protein